MTGGVVGGVVGEGVGDLRARIEAVDQELVALVGERARLARAIGLEKRRSGSPTLDPEREASVIRRAVEAGRREGLPDEGVRALFWTLVGLCREAQLDGEP
jgi:chorismate mutase / prephenate dehydratase